MILFLTKCYITSAPILYNIPWDIILLFSLPPSCQLRFTHVAPPSRIAGFRWSREAKGCCLSFGKLVHSSLGLQLRMSLGRRLLWVVQKFDARKMLLVKNIYCNFAPQIGSSLTDFIPLRALPSSWRKPYGARGSTLEKKITLVTKQSFNESNKTSFIACPAGGIWILLQGHR